VYAVIDPLITGNISACQFFALMHPLPNDCWNSLMYCLQQLLTFGGAVLQHVIAHPYLHTISQIC
jgi:hypothetical protein